MHRMQAVAPRPKSVKKYSFTARDKLFLDANVWLFIYEQRSRKNKKAAIYTDALRRINNTNSRIYIDVLVVSEFINASAKRKAGLEPRQPFKKFRKSPEFRPIAEEIAANVQRILKHCSRIDPGYG